MIDPRELEDVDPLLVDAAYAGRLWLSDLVTHERQYVVRELTRRGDSAQLIADRLHCKKRVIQRIRAEVNATA